MSYDISMPVDTVFNAIDDLSDLSENGGSTMTTRQMIDLAYVIFAKLPILQHDLRLWNRRPLTDKTWANMLVFPACVLTITLITTTLFKPFNTIPLLPERSTTQPLANPKTLIRSSAVPTLFAGIAHSPTNGVAALRASPNIVLSTNT